MKEKYISYYEGLQLRRNKDVVLYPIWFLARRLILSLAIVTFDQTVWWQLAIKTALVATSTIIVGQIEPFDAPQLNNQEFFNEVIIMIVLYHIFCFTPFVSDTETQYQVGYSIIFFVCLHFYVNFHLIYKMLYRDMKL